MSGKKDCKFCDKKGLLWLPLRYSAVGVDTPDAISSLPTLSGKLGKGVTDLALTEAKYAVRLLRSGYLYVLLERKGIKYWEAYMVLDDAFLYKFTPEDPPQTAWQFSCEPHTCGINASMVAIPEAKDVPKLWALFTPSPLTRAKLAEYKANADKYAGEGKMQTFSPADWLAGSTAQPHTLLAPELLTKVAEYVLFTQPGNPYMSPLGKALEQQLFPASVHAYCGSPPNGKGEYFGRLGGLYNAVKRNGYAAMALYDHIGVTQELNDFRNAPLEGLQSYLSATDEYGASNQQRLQIYEAIQEIKNGFEQGVVRSTQVFLNQHKEGSDHWFAQRRNEATILRAEGRAAEADAVDKDIDASLKKREENYKKALEQSKVEGLQIWEKKYAPRLDESEIQTFKDKLDSNTQRAFGKAEKRAPDHLKWFEADRLIQAFDVFDTKAQTSGYEFAIESAICSFGLSGCKVGEDKIDAWVQATSIDRKNLYMRGYYHNQQELIDAAKQAYADIQAAATAVTEASGISAAVMLKATKGLVDGFKKTDSAFDEWARNQKQMFSQKWVKPSMLGNATGQQYALELILFHKASEITRTICRKGLGGGGDVFLTARLSGVLYARLGGVAEKLRYDELMLKIDKSKLADGYKGRSAERNKELAESKARSKANAQIKKEIAPSLGELVADAQEKNKLKIKLEDLVGSDKPPTNNYHQTRLGVLLGCIELIGLGEKLTHAKWDMKSTLEIGGSVMAVGSIILDTYYSAAKSIREIAPYKNINAINKGADIVRGGFKLGAGVLGMGAGFCGVLLDAGKATEEWNKEEANKTLFAIYTLRAVTGFVSAGLTMVAAFSYSENLCKHLATGYAKHQLRYRALWAAGGAAAKLAVRVRLLVWIARLNWVGLALTAVEIGYLLLKDDDLQNWCEKSVFRNEKKAKNWLGRMVTKENYEDAKKELEELERASRSVGLGT